MIHSTVALFRPCRWLALAPWTVSLALAAEIAPTPVEFGGATPLQWSQRLAQSEMARDNNLQRWDYTTGLFALAALRLGDATDDAALRRFASDYIHGLIGPDGAIRGYDRSEYNLDMITPGKVVLELLARRPDENLRQAARTLRTQLQEQPRTTVGGFWHKQRYPSQMWLDGLYMAAPFYLRYGLMFDDRTAVDDAIRQILLMDRYAYDAGKGLHYHAWNEDRKQEWADPATGHSPNFWGRAIGWYSMAVVDCLDLIPADHPDRAAVVDVLRRLADGMVRYQDANSGLWWQVVDQGGREGNYLEATASCMFVYSLAKGINQGHLPRARYEAAIRRGYAGIIRDLVRVDSDGRVNLLQCCSVAGLGGLSQGRPRDGTFEYYISERVVENDLKGVGPFILAGIELDRLWGATEDSRPSTQYRAGGGADVFGAAASGSTATYTAGGDAAAAPSPPAAGAAGWDAYPALLARIKAPSFPARDFPIRDFGAVADGRTDNTEAIRRAIEACHAAGGGRVLVTDGVVLTAAIHLKSNVNLHVAEGATLKFIPDPTRYPLVFTRWEGVECMNYSPLIYAYEQENIAVTGRGVLDGSADETNWWSWTRRAADGGAAPARASRDRLFTLGEQGVPVADRVFGAGDFLRPNFIQPYRCRNVLIEGVTIHNSPMWEVHPVLSTNVTVRGLHISSHGPNNDGCNPESSRDVLIEDCVFDTGDDCIAIKSGRNNDGRRVGVAAENIIVRSCVMKDGHGGVVMGSEISGHCRNVFIEDCEMDSPNLDRALRFKDNAVRGGIIENVFMRNVRVGQVAEAVLTIDLLYEEGARGEHQPVVRNVALENVTSEASPRVMWIAGFEGAVIEDIRFSNCTFRGVRATERVQHAGSISFDRVTIEPAELARSRNSPTTASAGGGAAVPVPPEAVPAAAP